MATIVLYAGTIQSMPGLLRNVQTATLDYQTELLKIRNQSLSVNQSICNLSEVIDSLQASTKIQEAKIRSLETLEQKVEQFAGEVVRIDAEVAEFIRSQRQEFYDSYTYLKPESERNGWEHICAGLQTAGEFCKEHWKGIVTVVLVVAAVVVIILTAGAGVAALGPFLTILVGACKGLVMGAAIGGVMGGLSSMTYGGSFWEGLENGAFSGALTGMVFGGLGGICEVLGNSCQFLTKIGYLKNTGGALKATERLASATEALVPLAKAAGAVAWGMFGFDVASVGAGAVFGKDNWLTTLNTKLHQNALYNAYQTFISVLAVGSGGFLKGLSNPTCFVAGTMVLTATGGAAIETIAAGDRVISTNPETGETTEKRVVETYVRKTMTLVHLTAGKETLHTTVDHPFYVKERGFLPAAGLAVGDILLDCHGEELPVENVEVELRKEPVTVYNFQVEDFHTYHVGRHGVLVHNAEYGSGSSSMERPSWRKSEIDAAQDFPDYLEQKSFINGEEVPYGTKGSVRPDLYKEGASIDVKNYKIESSSGRSNLARNIEKQYYQRLSNLQEGTKQSVLIDIRGQNVSQENLNALCNDIMNRTNNGIKVRLKSE